MENPEFSSTSPKLREVFEIRNSKYAAEGRHFGFFDIGSEFSVSAVYLPGRGRVVILERESNCQDLIVLKNGLGFFFFTLPPVLLVAAT